MFRPPNLYIRGYKGVHMARKEILEVESERRLKEDHVDKEDGKV